MGMGINPSFVAEPQSCTHYRHNRPCVHVLNCTYSVLYTQTYMLYFCMYWYMFGIYVYNVHEPFQIKSWLYVTFQSSMDCMYVM